MTAFAALADPLQVEDWSELLERQKELEDNGMADGAERFRRRLIQAEVSGASSATGAARQLIQGALNNFENAIGTAISSSGPGHPSPVQKWCSLLGPDATAYMTMKAAVDATASGAPVSVHRVAQKVADLILDELRYRRFKELAPDLYQYKMESFDTSHAGHRARSLKASMSFAQIDTSDLDPPSSQKLRLGIALIDLLCQSTDWFGCGHLTDPSRKYGTKTVLVMSPETQQRLCDRNNALSLLSPLAGPMVIPPLPWGPGQRGGYRFALRNKFELVRRPNKDHARRLEGANMPLVYEAVNHIQSTAWRINTPVLELVEELISLGGGYAGLPRSEDSDLPEKPGDIDSNEEARKRWRSGAHAVRNQNYARRVKAAEVARTLAVAESVADVSALYFPHSLDFRGRIYPIASYLTPQGGDLSRSLLTFAEGKPLDGDGARWLAIHGANTMGLTPDGQKTSKMTLDEHVSWVEANRERIIEVADCPFETMWWIRAEKPLQFYAFAVDWTRYLRATERGEEYVSSLPIHMDGTANGLQHFAALLRDPISGNAVNLVPQDQPQDIYQFVADAILARLEAEQGSNPLARLWMEMHQSLGLIDRKFAKKPTMTFGYGSKRFGFTKQIIEFLKSHSDYKSIRAHFSQGEKPKLRIACSYMARVIWDALRTTAVAAFDSMAWMQATAKGIAANGKSASWTVPAVGFPVYQGYFKHKKGQIKTALAGKIVALRYRNPTKTVDSVKEQNAIAPNIVHSLDAAALMLTVARAAEQGITSFGMVHDSYGTVAADCAGLSRILRESFITLYSEHDVIGHFHRQLSQQWADPEACPAPPPQGSLDLQDVLRSEFFFC